ncbi:MAG: hypothetical protein ACOCSD_05245 [Halolamina sp.]
MSASAIDALRVTLLVLGVSVFLAAVWFGATMPEPPPDSDGVPVGFAVVFVVLGQTAGALLALVGYALPAGSGRLRFGPLAARSAATRVAAAAVGFTVTTLLLTVLGWVLPDSLPRIVTGTHGFLWLGAAVGSVVGVVLAAVLAVGTVLWRVVRGEPIRGRGN